MKKLLAVTFAAALALGACKDAGKTPAQKQAAKDSAASVIPANDLPPSPPPAQPAPTTDTAAAVKDSAK
jgi:hypothetical protein